MSKTPILTCSMPRLVKNSTISRFCCTELSASRVQTFKLVDIQCTRLPTARLENRASSSAPAFFKPRLPQAAMTSDCQSLSRIERATYSHGQSKITHRQSKIIHRQSKVTHML